MTSIELEVSEVPSGSALRAIRVDVAQRIGAPATVRAFQGASRRWIEASTEAPAVVAQQLAEAVAVAVEDATGVLATWSRTWSEGGVALIGEATSSLAVDVVETVGDVAVAAGDAVGRTVEAATGGWSLGEILIAAIGAAAVVAAVVLIARRAP